MDALYQRTIANDAVSLHELMEEATQFLESRGVDERAVFLVNLGIEETVTNIIKYGYDAPGSYQIEVRLNLRADSATLVIIDDGHQFNPLLHERKPPAKNIEEREIGGMGIDLLKKMLDRMEYRRDEGRNVLEMMTRRNVPVASN